MFTFFAETKSISPNQSEIRLGESCVNQVLVLRISCYNKLIDYM